MDHAELDFVRWLRGRLSAQAASVTLGVGDDLAVVRAGVSSVLIGSDMLLDGVHFHIDEHAPEAVGRKALGCVLSDCAAMAVKPTAAIVSVALPKPHDVDAVRRLFDGLAAMADEFACPIVGGDTTSWSHPLAIDVAVLATPFDGIEPIRRDGGRPGDLLCLTGPLGGSLLGRHLTFTPRVREAERIARALGGRLHAMIDVTDGLSLDCFRLCDASDVGAEFDESLLSAVIHPDAVEAGRRDGRSPLDHAMEDGEDFELLMAIAPDVPVPDDVRDLLLPVGRLTEGSGMSLRRADGSTGPLEPRGYEHLR